MRFLIQKIKIKLTIFWEKINNQDFSTITPISDIGVEKDLQEKIHHGSNSCGKHLKNVFSFMRVDCNDSILDVGSAKGGAINCMRRFPFKKIAGVEISYSLYRVSIKNFKKYYDLRIELFNCDARNFEEYSRFNMFYLYNPFNEEILEEVIKKIKNSISKDREIFIIYNLPRYHNILLNYGFFKLKEFPAMWGNKIFLYSNSDNPSRILKS